jgi:hypothetical protein
MLITQMLCGSHVQLVHAEACACTAYAVTPWHWTCLWECNPPELVRLLHGDMYPSYQIQSLHAWRSQTWSTADLDLQDICAHWMGVSSALTAIATRRYLIISNRGATCNVPGSRCSRGFCYVLLWFPAFLQLPPTSAVQTPSLSTHLVSGSHRRS